MMEHEPTTQPHGDLDPPSRVPPTAVAAATPSPAPQRRPTRHHPDAFRRRSSWWQALELAFDALDLAADRVADVTGVRGKI
jgi:hypothetical protein